MELSPHQPATHFIRRKAARWEQVSPAIFAAGWCLAILGVLFFSWREVALTPAAGLDYSWAAALHMAAEHGVSFGDRLDFTYGPLGFLTVPQIWYSDTGELAFLYIVILRLSLALVLFAAASKSYGRLAGFIIAVVVGATTNDFVQIFVVIAMVWALQADRGATFNLVLCAAAGAFAAVQLLVQISVGVQLIVIVGIAALSLQGSRSRQALASIGGFFIALFMVWIISGQHLGGLMDYLHNSVRIASGYSSAMGAGDPTLQWQYYAALLVVLFGVAAAVATTTGSAFQRRVGVLAVWLTFSFFEFKEGFQRHDVIHGCLFFEALLAGYLAFTFPRRKRLVGFAGLATLFALTLAAQDQTLRAAWHPLRNMQTAVRQMEDVFDRGKRSKIMEEGRGTVIRTEPLDAETLKLLRGRTVQVAPWNADVVWAYRLHWAPIPVFQSYVAYTTGLDQFNADDLGTKYAPERILLNNPPSLDNRVEQFDEPLTERTILCSYRELHATAAWDVLAHGRDRCGSPTLITVTKAAWGQQVPVPPPPSIHTLVILRLGGVQVARSERLGALLYRTPERFIQLNGGTFRLVPGTAGDGLILGASPESDFSPPFTVAPNPPTVAVLKEGTAQPTGQSLTYAFYAVNVTSGPRY